METVLVAVLFYVLPLALTIGLRTSAGVMFFAACGSIVLLGSLDTTFVAAAGAVMPGDGEAIVRLLVALGSILIAALAFRNTVVGMKLPIHVILVVLLGSVLWLELPSLTGADWLIATQASEIWELIDAFRSPIIAVGLAVSLLSLITKQQHHAKKSKH